MSWQASIPRRRCLGRLPYLDSRSFGCWESFHGLCGLPLSWFVCLQGSVPVCWNGLVEKTCHNMTNECSRHLLVMTRRFGSLHMYAHVRMVPQADRCQRQWIHLLLADCFLRAGYSFPRSVGNRKVRLGWAKTLQNNSLCLLPFTFSCLFKPRSWRFTLQVRVSTAERSLFHLWLVVY